jgi:hypothetical protein
MKRVLISCSDGSVMLMSLLPRQVRRISDQVTLDVLSFSRAGAVVRLKLSENTISELPADDFDNGTAPEGWEFLYATTESQIAKLPTDKQALVTSHQVVPFAAWKAAREANIGYRNAFTGLSGNAPTVDMTKARTIHRNFLRKLREPRWRALDVAYAKADETGNNGQKTAIRNQKNALRDAPQDVAIDNAPNLTALKAVIPAALQN